MLIGLTVSVGVGDHLAGVSVKEFVEACKKATGVNITITYMDRRPGDYAEVYSDPTKIKSELNWTAQHTNLTKTLRVAWKWRKAHPRGYNNVNYVASKGLHQR